MKPITFEHLQRAAQEDPAGFWAAEAQKIPWLKNPSIALEQFTDHTWNWFPDGITNMSYLCIDRHIQEGRGDQVALYYDSPVSHTKTSITYHQLLEKVSRTAGALVAAGIQLGDRVIIYMPMIPEAVISMLACARIGAVHSVVFGGFSPEELCSRINDARPKLLITASAGIEIDRVIPYKPLVDEAIRMSVFPPELVWVFDRKLPNNQVDLQPRRDFIANDFPISFSPEAYVPVPSGHPLYILYTSGTTGKPKGIQRNTGDYAVALRYSMEYIYGVKPRDVYWAASDIGWVVGHSYIVYGPLLMGCSTILFEGKPVRTPDASTFWRVLDEYKVNVFFTAPTAIRAIRKEDSDGSLRRPFSLETLRAVFLAGERCDVPTAYWLEKLIQKPVIDHWWQTETGWPVSSTMAGLPHQETLFGSAGKPVPGYHIDILDETGEPLLPGQEGFVALRLPLPPGCLNTLYNDHDRFIESYLSRFPGYYQSGDGGFIDNQGHLFVMGRVDDVINVAGHRLSTGQMEEIVGGNIHVAENAVVGIADQLRGHVPLCLVVLKDSSTISQTDISNELIHLMRDKIGAVAFFRQVIVVQRLPKTRSGKILRRIIRNIADGESYQVPGTIEDPSVLGEIHHALQHHKIGLAFSETAQIH